MEEETSLRRQLEKILRLSPVFQPIFELATRVELHNWYVAGGCVTQTIWNWKMDFDLLHGLRDVDLVYFKAEQSVEDEESDRLKIENLFGDIPIPVDVTNEARVHEWYPTRFGYEIPAALSTEDAISTWLPAFCIGVRPQAPGLLIFAPFGLTDAFDMIVRPNKRQITEKIYNEMTLRLRKDWPTMQALPWS